MNDFIEYKNLSLFYSSKFTMSFLKKNYENLSLKNPKTLAFESCYSFISYLEHGQLYLQQAELSPIQIKPLLSFYGLLHLLKACILKVNPYYPENSNVLSHGVSTKKRKKSGYEFLNDEIKIQKNGFFTHAATHLYQLSITTFEKYSMKQLLSQLDDFTPLLQSLSLEPSNKLDIPNLLVYYLIFYNLSMIVRYESEWWSDLLKNYNHFDYIFIHQFLSDSSEKMTAMTLDYLLESKTQ